MDASFAARNGNGAAHSTRTLFAVDVRLEPNRVVVCPRGELDVATVGVLEGRMRSLCDTGTALVLDPGGLTFIDSTGLRLLLRVQAYAERAGCSFAILDRRGPVRRLLTLTRLLDRFESVAR